jgi:hypothetical protein
LNRVKCFSKINFNKASRQSYFPFILPEQFQQEIKVVSHAATPQEGILHGTDDAIKGGPHPVSKDFLDVLVNYITARNGPEITSI